MLHILVYGFVKLLPLLGCETRHLVFGSLMDADGCCGFNVSKYRRDGIWGGWVELHKGSNSGDKTYGMGLKNKKKLRGEERLPRCVYSIGRSKKLSVGWT